MVSSVAFSPDGRRALSGSIDETLRLWEVDTGKELSCFRGHTLPVSDAAFTPDGRYALSGSYDHTLRLWRLPEPSPPEPVGEVRRFVGHTEVIHRVALSPDGRLAVSTSGAHYHRSSGWHNGSDFALRLWDVATGQEIRRFEGHTNASQRRRIFSRSDDLSSPPAAI